MGVITSISGGGPGGGSGGAGGIGGSTGATDNAVLRADGAGGATLQSSSTTLSDSSQLSGFLLLNKPLTNAITDRDEASGSGTTDSGSFFENSAATLNPTTVTLDTTPVVGQHHIFCCLHAQGITIIASGAQVIRVGATASSAGGTLSSTTVGSRVDLLYATTNIWVGVSSGTWNAT